MQLIPNSSRRGLMAALFFFASFVLQSNAFAGGEILHTPLTSLPEGQPVYFESAFAVPVEHAYLNYRRPGQANFTNFEMSQKVNGSFSAYIRELNGLKNGDQIEYYISAETRSGQTITLPTENPMYMPFQMIISKRSVFQETGIEVVVLSPEPDEKTNKKDVVIAISLFSDNAIDVKNLRLKLDGDDITAKADVTPELITYSPKDLGVGQHVARLLYISGESETQILTEFTFEVVISGGEDILASKGFRASSDLTSGGSETAFEDGTFRLAGRAEHRAQQNLGETTVFERVGGDISYEKKWFQVGATFDWDSEDNPKKNQPISRYLVTANVDNLVILNYGDTYPTFSPVTLNGTRVRGFSGGVYLGVFNFEYVTGEVNRKVLSDQNKKNKSRIDSIFHNTDTSVTSYADAYQAYFESNPNGYFSGDFKRNMTAGRFSVGPQSFQFGVSFVKTKDQVSSLLMNPITAVGYNGLTPQENLVAGADFRASMFNKRLNFDASVASAISNTDITSGSISHADLDSADIDLTKSQYDLVKKFITLNANLDPLITEFDKNLLAYTVGSSISAYNNNLSVRYRFNGAFFQSYGASVARDQESFEIVDRMRFWQNRIFLTINYATMKNNLAKTVANTPKTNTLGFNASFFLPNKLPSVTLGYQTMNRDNGFEYTGSATSANSKYKDQIRANARPEDNTTNTLSFNTTYGFTFSELRNSASFSLSNSTRKDNSKDIGTAFLFETEASVIAEDTIVDYYKAAAGSKSNTIGLSLSTDWKFPLRTSIGFSNTSGETKEIKKSDDNKRDSLTITKKTGAFSLNANGDYLVFQNDDVRINTTAGYNFASVTIPNVPDVTLQTISLGSRINFFEKNNVTLSYSITSGLKIPTASGGSKSVTNSLFLARYEYIF
ncbi:MAG TPA: hypothetical protein PLA15_08105 [bacterium]|nr:hypothetical protein [bacterium]